MSASLDLHKKYAQAVVMSESGAVLKEERIESDPVLIERFSNSLEDSTSVVIESSSTWYWVYQILAMKHHVILANPAKTKAIAQATNLPNLLSKKFLTRPTNLTQRIKFKTIRVSEKGQVVIPVEIQREMGIRKGDELLLIQKGEKLILEKPKKFAHTLQNEFDDIQQISEASLKKVWLNKGDEIWITYLEGSNKQ